MPRTRLPTRLVVFRQESDVLGEEYSLEEFPGATALLGELRASHTSLLDETGALSIVERATGEPVEIERALETGALRLEGEYDYEYLRATMQPAVAAAIRASALVDLAIRRMEDCPEWDVDRDDEGVYLLDPSGEVRGEARARDWWHTDGPEHVRDLATHLISRLDLQALS